MSEPRKSEEIFSAFLMLESIFMTHETALTWSWLNVLNKKRYDALLQAFGDLDDALAHLSLEMLRSLGCREETAMEAMNRLDEFYPESYHAELQKRSIEFISIEGDLFPSALRQIPDAPVFLYYRGDIAILGQLSIGLVGTREMSPYGKRVVAVFVPEFVRAQLITVSGLAEGIDAEVAKETLHAGGQTVAVLGHGLGRIYPSSNAKLAEEIVKKGGLLLSEFPLDMVPDKYTFPARNRIIAGCSLGTVVLEAGEGSGALITAELALDYGRDVFAVPGQIFDPNYAGCHKLISGARAKLVTDPVEVLRELGIVTSQSTIDSAFEPENDLERVLYATLSTMPQSVTDIVERSKLDTGTVNATLTMMELRDAARNVGNGMWVRR